MVARSDDAVHPSSGGDDGGEERPSLPKLLASLGLGARSVNSLPLSSSRGDAGNDGDDALEDEHAPCPSPCLGGGEDDDENDSAADERPADRWGKDPGGH